ncbi:MAG: hypothetical protein ACR2MQ_06865 [Gemmatimonadaceae bacterium]
MVQHKSVFDRSGPISPVDQPFADRLIHVLGENRFYALVAMGTVAELEDVLLDTTRHYAHAVDAVNRVAEGHADLSHAQLREIDILREEFAGASSLALRMTYQRLLEQLEEALAVRHVDKNQNSDIGQVLGFLEDVAHGFTLGLYRPKRMLLDEPSGE